MTVIFNDLIANKKLEPYLTISTVDEIVSNEEVKPQYMNLIILDDSINVERAPVYRSTRNIIINIKELRYNPVQAGLIIAGLPVAVISGPIGWASGTLAIIGILNQKRDVIINENTAAIFEGMWKEATKEKGNENFNFAKAQILTLTNEILLGKNKNNTILSSALLDDIITQLEKDGCIEINDNESILLLERVIIKK